MKTLWYVAKKDLLQVLKDRNAFFLMLAVPLILIAVVGFALGNLFGDGSTQINIKVALSNQDTAANAFVGKSITNALKVNSKQLVITVNEYSDTEQVSKQVSAARDAADVGIVIPANASHTFIDSSKQGQAPKGILQFYTQPNTNDARTVIVQDIVNKVLQAQLVGNAAVQQVYAVCNTGQNKCAQETIHADTISSQVAQANNETEQAIQHLTAGKAVQVGTFDQTVPGYAIFFALFGLNAVAATILQEKEDGTFRRLLIAPIQKYALLGGKLLAQFILTLLQLTVIFVVGYFVFKMHVNDWPTVILLLLGTSFAATGLGILLVSVVKSRRQINSIVSLVTIITSAVGGAWWPLYLEPAWMQQLAKIGITAWAMEGLNGSMLQGKDLMGVLPNILGLFAYGAICFLIALRFFRFQEKTASA